MRTPRRLVQTWRAPFLGEPHARLTCEIEDDGTGVSRLTVTHDVTGAPRTAAQGAGEIPGAGGGWSQRLSDLKTLLETGEPLFGEHGVPGVRAGSSARDGPAGRSTAPPHPSAYFVLGFAAFQAGDFRLMLAGGVIIWTWAAVPSLKFLHESVGRT